MATDARDHPNDAEMKNEACREKLLFAERDQ